MGRPEPEQTVIGVDMEYLSTTFAIPDQLRDWKGLVTLPDIREHSRSGYLLPAEGGRWQAIIGERHLTTDRSASIDGFRELARTLRTQTIYDAITRAESLDTVHRFKFPENVWHHFDRLAEFPERLLPLGDAMCRFNPIYGQGMAVAAQQAAALRTLLQQRVHAASPLTGLQHNHLAAAVPVIDAAWSLSAIPDFAHPSTRGDRPADLEDRLRFTSGLYRLGARDPSVHKLLDSIRHLIVSPVALRDPELVRRVEAEMASA
jgi:2-polyprenyl-6-methoxyphenol hydroxylase-like FAD-dependent oxidoreductase